MSAERPFMPDESEVEPGRIQLTQIRRHADHQFEARSEDIEPKPTPEWQQLVIPHIEEARVTTVHRFLPELSKSATGDAEFMGYIGTQTLDGTNEVFYVHPWPETGEVELLHAEPVVIPDRSDTGHPPAYTIELAGPEELNRVKVMFESLYGQTS